MNRAGQLALITAGAIALYATMRLLPTGTNLVHADFRAGARGAGGAGALELCDPANPQFLPVAAVKSPVSAELKADDVARAGEAVRARLVLRTASGKVIGAQDLLVSHAEKLHLLAVDPSLRDYQHVHPVFERDGKGDGAWVFSFTPRFGGVYRIFCDFVPAATSRGLYASADLEIEGEPDTGWQPALQKSEAGFTLAGDVVAGRQATLILSSRETVRLERVMDAFAHLVAFDLERGGFAHLHPLEADKKELPLSFKVTVPRAGKYAVWAQLRIDGEDVFVPFIITAG